jgi:hypothetical protein
MRLQLTHAIRLDFPGKSTEPIEDGRVSPPESDKQQYQARFFSWRFGWNSNALLKSCNFLNPLRTDADTILGIVGQRRFEIIARLINDLGLSGSHSFPRRTS